jgi:hypothetical protein
VVRACQTLLEMVSSPGTLSRGAHLMVLVISCLLISGKGISCVGLYIQFSISERAAGEGVGRIYYRAD